MLLLSALSWYISSRLLVHSCCHATYVLASHNSNTLIVDQALVVYYEYLTVVLRFEHVEYDLHYGIVDYVVDRICVRNEDIDHAVRIE